MATVLRPVGYVGQRQSLIWTGAQSNIQAYLWGAGGGGGGDDNADDPGGNGSGGSFAFHDFTVNPGDEIVVAVGQGGRGGVRTPGTSIGTGGLGLAYRAFDFRAQPDVVAVTNSAWNYFLNASGVWDPGGPGITPIFRTYTVDFPVTGYYVFQYSADNAMTVELDGSTIISYGGFTADPVPFVSVLVSAGNHTLNIQASSVGAPAGVALTVDISFSGADGGNGSAGGNGGGAGGGGGAATVLLVNDTILAVAGGGGGGGGAGGNGNTSGTTGPDAPGPWSWPSGVITVPQDGQGSSIGGGGGGGGGGQSGGNGGRRGGANPSNPAGAADLNATGGSYGESLGQSISLASGRTPGNTGDQYYIGSSVGGYGGSRWPSGNGQPGGNGSAAFVMQGWTGGSAEFYIKNENLWSTVQDVYIRSNNQWNTVKNLYVKHNDNWINVFGTEAPVFSGTSGGFGKVSRRRGQA